MFSLRVRCQCFFAWSSAAFLAGLCVYLNELKMETVNMSFALVSYYLPVMGHSAKRKKERKKQKSVPREWRLLVRAAQWTWAEGNECGRLPRRGSWREK